MISPKQTTQISSHMPLEYLAKTRTASDGKVVPGISVAAHCQIVGMVARELMARMPSWLCDMLFPSGSALVAAVHDVGKISPGFQDKIHRACRETLNLGIPEDLDQTVGYHWAVSQAALENAGRYIPDIAGRHHGLTPASGLPCDEKFGGPKWQQQRESLVKDLENAFDEKFPEIKSDDVADVLSGLTTVADWIGSGPMFEEHHDDRQILISQALDHAGFVSPAVLPGLRFDQVFSFPPREAQQALIESVIRQGVYVFEAPMGLGKTEAALFAAYKMLEKNMARGIYFALPTQLTSDKIHERMTAFLERILEPGSSHRQALLLHGAAWLSKTEMGEEGSPGQSWFDARKRGLLAPFAVGTIDQALMAVMNVRHGFVRTFGLAGKVVILDEVHSYDHYTGTILDTLVQKLRKLGCTVIILSATLTAGRRSKILGIGNSDRDNANTKEEANLYPLITVSSTDSTEHRRAGKIAGLSISVRNVQNEEDAVEEALQRAESGQQVLWVENTVADAQERFKTLSARIGTVPENCGLLHSRFTRADREQKENCWVSVFGKKGMKERYRNGRLLVGTQVLEQSLDIDADFLVTRLAPTDMLLQRLGRLWRHRENDAFRPKEAVCEVWVLSPSLEDSYKDRTVFGKSANVYAPYVLCHTLKVWQRLRKLSLPSDIRGILEKTYAEDNAKNGAISTYFKELSDKREKLGRLARIGLSRGGKTLPESKASTRYCELEAGEVLLLKEKTNFGNSIRIKLMDGSTLDLPMTAAKLCASERRECAIALHRNIVRVPEYLLPSTLRPTLNFLKGYLYLGDLEESAVSAAIVDETGLLRGLDGNTSPVPGCRIAYNDRFGYYSLNK